MRKNLVFKSCEKGEISFVELTENLIASRKTDRPFHRICELMRKYEARTVCIHRGIQKEKNFPNDYFHLSDYIKDLDSSIKLTDITQVSFFARYISSSRKSVPANIRNEDILGTCVLVTFQPQKGICGYKAGKNYTFVYEAIVRLPSKFDEIPKNAKHQEILLKNYYHIFSEILIVIDGKHFNIPASYFCQSEFLQCACAQTSIRMALFHSGEPDDMFSYKKMNKIVEELRKQDHSLSKKSFSPDDGYLIREIEEVLRRNRKTPFILDVKQNPSISPYEFAYSLVESGIPSLIVFSPYIDDENTGHILPVIGHTTNSDEWLPAANAFHEDFEGDCSNASKAKYVSSSSWASHLIVNDDSLGAYYCLGERDLIKTTSNSNRKASLQSRILYVIGIVPKDDHYTINPYGAQQIAASCFLYNYNNYLRNVNQPWQRRFKKRKFTPKDLVLRTQLIGKENYLKHLKNMKDYFNNPVKLQKTAYKKLEITLPQKFWMVEFSYPEIYSVNLSKFGEILVKFNPAEKQVINIDTLKNERLCLAFRFINYLKTNSIAIDIGLKSHSPIYIRREEAI